MPAKGKKSERILTMSPLFRVGKVRVREDHYDFIDEWINYDSTLKNPKDDCLDAVEIALRTAGALFPDPTQDMTPHFDDTSWLPRGTDINDLARADLPGNRNKRASDDHMGAEW